MADAERIVAGPGFGQARGYDGVVMKESLRTRVLDAEVDCVDMPGALELVDSQIRYGEEPGTVLAVNPEKIYALRRNLFLRDFFFEGEDSHTRWNRSGNGLATEGVAG